MDAALAALIGYTLGLVLAFAACADGVKQSTGDRFKSRWEALKWIVLVEEAEA